MPNTVLIIDDEPTVLGTIADVLADEGYQTLLASSGLDGLAQFKKKGRTSSFSTSGWPIVTGSRCCTRCATSTRTPP